MISTEDIQNRYTASRFKENTFNLRPYFSCTIIITKIVYEKQSVFYVNRFSKTVVQPLT